MLFSQRGIMPKPIVQTLMYGINIENTDGLCSFLTSAPTENHY